MSKSSLSAVVSNLVRASMGTSISPSITDQDLDRHVAELILKEAKQKAESYGQLGIKAYLPSLPDPNAPRPNKRFLTSIIKSTDDHNKTILRAQALAAQEIKREKDERERRDRRARAEEAVAAERMRRCGRDYDEHTWSTRRDPDRRKGRDRNKEKPSRWESRRHSHDTDDDDYYRGAEERRSRRGWGYRSHSPSKELDHARKHIKSRQSPSPERPSSSDDHQRRRQRRHDHSDFRHRRRHTSRSASPRRAKSPVQPVTNTTFSKKRPRSISPSDNAHKRTTNQSRSSSCRNTPSPSRSSQTSPDDDQAAALTVETQPSLKGKAKALVEFIKSPPRTRSQSPPPRKTRRAVTPSASSYAIRSPSSSPPPLPLAQLPSKMDKYFQDSYDPRLDVAPLTTPNVPATGLVSDADFAGWDAMLELIRQRREDKAEKKYLERLGISKDQFKKKGSDRGAGGDSLMDIEYKKRGSVREWDLGKEGF